MNCPKCEGKSRVTSITRLPEVSRRYRRCTECFLTFVTEQPYEQIVPKHANKFSAKNQPPNTLLSADDVRAIRLAYKNKPEAQTLLEFSIFISRHYNVSYDYVPKLVYRRTWAWLVD